MKKISIPEHINLKPQIMPGIGATEGKQILLAVLPVLAVVVAYWMLATEPGPRLLALFGLVVYICICYAVFSSPEGGQSVYAYLSRWVCFLRTQQNFKYKQDSEVLRIVKKQEH